MTALFLTLLGLASDMLGVVCLFFWQVDGHRDLNAKGAQYATWGTDAEIAVKYRHHRRMTELGLILLVLGFLLQACGAYLSNTTHGVS